MLDFEIFVLMILTERLSEMIFKNSIIEDAYAYSLACHFEAV